MKHGIYKRLISVCTMLFVTTFTLPTVQAADPLDLATTPLSTLSVDKVKPNMLFVLDDSGSMGWEYLPTWAEDVVWGGRNYVPNPNHPGATYHNDASYNALAYNPAVTYLPPAYFDTNGENTTKYPSQDGMTTAKGASSDAKPNWRNVKNNAYSNSGTNNLETGGPSFQFNEASNPQYTVTIADEYCTAPDLRTCVAQSSASTTHPYAARIRWCSTAAAADPAVTSTAASAGLCQGTRVAGSFDNMRLPNPIPTTGNFATITLNSPRYSPNVSGVTVSGETITSGATSQSNNSGQLAAELANRINACETALVGNCTVIGYSAISNGNTVTITAPNSTTARPNVTVGGGAWSGWWYWRRWNAGYINVSTTAFSETVQLTSPRVTVNIVRGDDTYPYPGTNLKHSSRTDCAGDVCTYAEEMENYANWYTYYRSRMQLMKTATSLAFEEIDDGLRVGFMTINVSSSETVDFADFAVNQKSIWYDELFSTVPGGGTPLRRALSRAGRVYADKDSISNTMSNPMQYECQDNFTLLTTDGEWNSEAGYKLDQSAMTDQDANAAEKGKYEGDGIRNSQTLADVAKYYFDTDLRTSALGNCTGDPVTDKNGNIVTNNVCETPNTSPLLNKVQNMVTLTLGLGVDGTLAYDVNYGEDVSGDYKSIYDGNRTWPDPVDELTKVDDLWHAAVNGGGRYYSAKSTSDLIRQLKDAIASIREQSGSGTGLATSAVKLDDSATDYAYLATFTTNVWSGNVQRRKINADGSIEKTPDKCVENVVPQDRCQAPGELVTDNSGNVTCVTKNATQNLCTVPLVNGDECHEPVAPICTGVLKTQASRSIYFNKDSALQALANVSDLTAAQQANFDKNFLLGNLSQAAQFDATQIANLTGQKLLEYILGDKTYEQNAGLSDNQLFRIRTATLGDVVNAKPSYLAASNFNYGDAGYQDYKTSVAYRAATVFVGSNDGMLHAFDADTLEERWAFVPSMVISNLWKLADRDYDTKHSYYVNGDFKIYDICVAADCDTATKDDWRTVLIGGLDGGGRGYYALDVTVPTSPKLMWEIDPNTSGFQNLGYTFSEPVATKRSGDKKWVVVFASGYNNIPDNDAFYNSTKSTAFKPNLTPQYTTGDGKGYLYVVDAKTGALVKSIGTGKGTQASPSGLGKVSAYVENALANNETTYVYASDLDGNVWRFNIDSGASTVVQLAKLKDQYNKNQPVTTRPVLGKVKTNGASKKLIIVGTGKFLEPIDIDYSLFTPQSLYAIVDTANDTDTGIVVNNPRSVSGFIKQTVVASSDPNKTNVRVSGTQSDVDLSTDLGWYIDWPDNGERQDVNAQLILGTLIAPTRVPTGTSCQPAGYGWFNFLDYKTGKEVQVAGAVVSERTQSPIAGFNISYTKDGKLRVTGTTSSGDLTESIDVPNAIAKTGFQVKRSIWREIIDVD